jgi:acetyl-CoA carboxylase carboxyltransferase component
MTIQEKIADLRRRHAEARAGGGPERTAKQKEGGRLTARERLEALFDAGTFRELDVFALHRCRDFDMDKKLIYGDGVITGFGRINGRLAYAFAQDFTCYGGSLGEVFAEKICKVMDLAMKNGAPMIGLNDSGGARIQEGVVALGGYGEIFFRNTVSSGVIPQISMILGPCAGGAVYSPALTDFIVMIRHSSYMFITGPEVIETVTGEKVSKNELGGAMSHNTRSGVAHFAAETEEEGIELVKEMLSYMPGNNKEDPPFVPNEDPADRMDPELTTLVPDDPNKPYDMHGVITRVVDEGVFLEVHPHFARNIIVGFARLGGRSVGIVANQPAHLAGCLDIDASWKGGRFVRFCDAFNIPLVTFVDVPGFLPGIQQEYGGIIRNGAKILYAFCEATVPKITVITRKAYGGAYDVMCSKHIRADLNYAWPSTEIAVMGGQGACNILYRKEIKESADPAAKRVELVREYNERFASPYLAAARGYVDDVIEPQETRPRLIEALEACAMKREARPSKKHGNIPL